jgi:microcin C transport system substrate-binding protein
MSLSFSAIASTHGFSTFGKLKYPKNFTHFDYVNPNAPKGGAVTIASIGTFDNLNPFILKGVAPSQMGLIYDTLLTSSADENSSAYALVAESIILPKHRKWIEFEIRKEAHWNDNTPITAEDILFSFNILKKEGHPYYKAYYQEVTKGEIISDKRIRFYFANTTNRELPIIIGGLPVLPKRYYDKAPFNKTSLIPPLSSGPYRIKEVKAGRSIVFERDPNYWGKALPVNKGRYNFDTITVDYYRDSNVAIEAFKAGEYDFRKENIAKNWAKAYQIPHIEDGRVIKEALIDGKPTGMQAFIFNSRRSMFSDPKVREALSYAYDFEWSNKNLFFSAYRRNTSFFGNSIFAASGLPSEDEIKLLTPFRDTLPKRVFSKAYTPPINDGFQTNRQHLIKARDLLEESGWKLKDMKLINPHTNKPASIEFLLVSPSFERVVAPYIRNLKKLGITATIRTVDAAQYIKRRETFDFDVIVHWYTQTNAPGNELLNYWHSDRADVQGSLNLIGIKNPAVDKMLEHATNAKSEQELASATRALDRVLLWNFYVVPHWHNRTHRLIYWNKFGRPENTPPFSLGFLDSWWIDEQKKQKLNNKTPQE